MDIAGQDAELPEMRRRARIFALCVMVVFGAIAVRLFYLQIIEGDTFYKFTSDSIVRTQIIPAVRGEVRDRKNRVLARMRPSANLWILPHLLSSESFEHVRTVLNLSPDEAVDLWDRINTDRRDAKDREHGLLVKEDIPRQAQARFEELALELPGVRLEHAIRRDYPNGSVAAHLLGYMNEISNEEVRQKKDGGYRAGDLVGRTGVERQMEGYLRGRPGFDKQVVDRRGLPRANINELVEGPVHQDAVAGNHVVLTLDLEVQKIAERAMRGQLAGGAVVMDVSSGRLLAMVSRPTFDPNEMSGHLSPEASARLLADRYRPLRDKTVSETYFPGSTFKVVSALSALEDRLITPDDRTKCHGSFELGGRRFKCTKTHLTVSLYEAIVESCNVYFYELGARPGMLDRLAKFATDMGLGAPTGLGLNGEEGGFIPTEEWYREQKRENPKAEGFQVGQALNAVIGQGSTRVTLVQMATLYAALANGGKLWLPQIVDHVESPSGQVIEEYAPRVRRELSVSPENIAFVRQALVGVVNESKGTAYRTRLKSDVEVAGKTGTAQVRKLVRHGEPVSGYEQNDHAWFVGFAPAGDPKIAVAVLIEHGGHGGEVAAPVAMEIVHNYFEQVAPQDRNAPRVGLLRRRRGASYSIDEDTGVETSPSLREETRRERERRGPEQLAPATPSVAAPVVPSEPERAAAPAPATTTAGRESVPFADVPAPKEAAP
jgi:penicillin-binding protein 2